MSTRSQLSCTKVRRRFLKRIPWLMSPLMLLVACQHTIPSNDESLVFNKFGAPDNTITISSDTILSANPKFTAYNVVNDSTLDLNGFKLDGRNSAGEHFTSVNLLDGSKVTNGTIAYSNHGVTTRVTLEAGWTQILEALPQADRAAYIQQLEDSVTKSPEITNVVFELNKIGTYLTHFTKGAVVKNNKFIKGRLGMYLDSYSNRALIEDNVFSDIGKDYYIKKYGFNVPYSREAIAVDNSSHNTITCNTFSAPQRGGIYLYKNCGEADQLGLFHLPREGGSNDNHIFNNTFKAMKPNYLFPKSEPAIWVASRWVDRLTTPCREDDEGDLVLRTDIHDNHFEDVYLEFKEKG